MRNEDLSVSGMGFSSSFERACQVFQFLEVKSSPANCFASELGNFPADGGRGLRQGDVCTSKAPELGGGVGSEIWSEMLCR